MIFSLSASIPTAFADVDLVGIGIFCENEQLLAFTGLIPFLEICPIQGTPTGTVDSDGDGLLDTWETDGIDGDGDGTPDFFLDGADPQHIDIFVEVDYMQFHNLTQTVVDNLVQSFANAPVSNLDNVDGITLHLQLDEQLDHGIDWIFNDENDWPTFDGNKTQYFGTSQEQSNPDFLTKIRPAKFKAYHYAVIIHNVASSPTTGIAEIGGNDFVVSLGNNGEGDVPTGHVTVDHNVVEGTFMHELGHNLGLFHGGFKPDDLNNNNEIDEEEDLANNCKPNHLSVINYSFQLPGPMKLFSSVKRPLDYSRSEITPSLNETALIESIGIGASEPSGLFTIYGPLENTTVVQTGNQIDWNDDGDFDDAVDRNINRVRFACDNDLLFTELKGHDDWNNLDYDFKDSDHFAEGIHPAPDEITELTQDQIEQLMNLLNRISPNKDSFLTQGGPNSNEGANPILRIISSDKNRPVIAFDQTKIEIAAAGETLQSAKLRLYIIDNGNNWGSTGRNIAIHSLTQDWKEGNGWNTGNNISGDGSGVTWNCPIDTDISNNQNDCVTQWSGGSFTSVATNTVLITNDMTNQFIEFDVTSDVQAFLDGTSNNFGWIIKKGDEALNGSLDFASKESIVNNPELLLVFEG